MTGLPASVLSVLVQARGIKATNAGLMSVNTTATRTATAARGAATSTSALGKAHAATAAEATRQAKAATAVAGGNTKVASAANAAATASGKQATASAAAGAALSKQAAAANAAGASGLKAGNLWQDAAGRWRTASGRFASAAEQQAAAVNTGTTAMTRQTRAAKAMATANGAASVAATRSAQAAKYSAIGVAGAAALSVRAASQFESSFAEVRKTVDTNERGFDRLEGGLRGLAKTIPISVNELNALAGQAGALGIASKDIVKFTRTAAELGIATDLSAEDAANALARLSNIMGTAPKDFRRLGSTFVQLGNDGASTEREIADMALRLAATGKQVGLNEAQVLSFSSALASVGIQAEAGGSAFSTAFSRMALAVEQNGKKLNQFADVAGMSGDEFAAAFKDNAALAMVAFTEGLGKIKSEGGSALLALDKLGIKEIRLKNALLSAAGAGDLFRDQLATGSKEWERNAALTGEASKRYDTLASQWQVIKNQANDWAITVGQKLIPELKTLMSILRDPNLSAEEKFDRIADQLNQGLDKALSKAADAAGEYGPTIVSRLASSMASAWADMNPFAKLLTAAVIIRMVGGPGALKATGLLIGRLIGGGIATGAATGAAAGVGGGAAAGAAGGVVGGMRGKLLSIAKRGGLVGVGLLLADGLINEMGRRAQERSNDLIEAIGAKADAGKILGVDTGKLPGGLYEDEQAARKILPLLDQINGKRGMLAQADINEIAATAHKLDLTKQQAAEMSRVIDLLQVGKSLGINVDLGMDPAKLAQIDSSMQKLKAGFFTSTGDIAKVSQRNMQIVANVLGKGTADGRRAAAANLRATAQAFSLQMLASGNRTKAGMERIRALIREADLISPTRSKARQFGREWGRGMDTSKEVTRKGVREMIREAQQMPAPMRRVALQTWNAQITAAQKSGKITKTEAQNMRSKVQTAFQGIELVSKRKAKGSADAVIANTQRMVNTSSTGLGILGDNANSALRAFDVATVNFAIKTWNGGVDKKQRGGVMAVPGHGTGDKVHALLEPGEVIWNKKAVKRYFGTPQAANQANIDVPRFQKGGIAGKASIDRLSLTGPDIGLRRMGQGALDKTHKGAQRMIRKEARDAAAAMAAVSGGAVSTTGLVPQVLRALAWARSHGWTGSVTSGFRDPAKQLQLWNNRGNNPFPVAPPGSSSHEKGQAIDVSDPAGFGRAMATAPPNARLYSKVPGDPIHFSVTGFQGGGIAGMAKAAKGGDKLDKWDRVFPAHGLGDLAGRAQMSERGIRMLLETHGGRHVTPYISAVLAKVFRKRESLGYPGIVAADGGIGLGQITNWAWPKGSPLHGILAKLGGLGAMRNPVQNSKMVGELVGYAIRDFGDPFQPWAASNTPAFAASVPRDVKSVFGKNGAPTSVPEIGKVKPPKTPKGKGLIPKALRQVARAKRKRGRTQAINRAVKALKKIGLGGAYAKLDGLAKEATKFGEYADRAGQLTVAATTSASGAEIPEQPGIVFGHGEAHWLTRQLEALRDQRNMLIRAHDQIVKGRDRTTRIIAEAERQLVPVREQRQKAVGELNAAKRALNQAKGPRAVKAAREQVRKAEAQLAPWTHRRDALVGIIKGAKGHRTTLNRTRGDVLVDLDGVQGSGPIKQMASLPAPGVLGGQIFQTQMALRDLQARTDAAGGTTSTGSDDERVRLLEDLLRQANQRTALSESQARIVQDFRGGLPGFAGYFATGGHIPAGMWGIAGERGPEPIMGPAQVVSNTDAQTMFGGGDREIRVVIEDNRVVVYDGDRKIEEVATDVARREMSKAGRRSTLTTPGGAR